MPGGSSDNTAKLVRRLAQLKSAFIKKRETVRQAMMTWDQCRHSQYLFDSISQSLGEATTNFDDVTNSMEDLQMSMEESVWETEYKEKQLEVEEMYARLVEEGSVVAMQYEDACEKQS